ncbi:MAG: LuxR C-terminal-related transcriptional regulator [Chloroflexota bacterium]|nr:LuxR C-terminal-related transcriptional regulator [Chloroflexota bacterium]
MSNENRPTALVEDETLIYQRDGEYHQIQVGTSVWYAWLQTATLLRVRTPFGTFTVRREQTGNKRGNRYWRAYHKRDGTLHRVYLGLAEEVTLQRLRTIAARFFAPPPCTREEREPSILPLSLTSLIGREREIIAVCTLLVRPEVRILTLTGTGGVGKTHLALAIAAEVQEHFPDGICFVSLAPIRDVDLILPAIVQALGLQERNRPPLEVLQAELREQHRLLVLDNFEQVVTAAPVLVDLLAACQRLKLLVTSREVLRVRGEREFVVQPLALPDLKQPPADETLIRYGAVALFLERAREVQPIFELTVLTAPLIAEICWRLDGLPLALELAAARLKVLSLQTLLERLEHRLHILTGRPRDLPVRQQTLRQTIAWSYDLLSYEEQRLFRLLSVFVNGCTLEAMEAVYSALGGERAQVLDQVTSLFDKHLLYRGDQSDHTSRLLLHETLREYGLEALDATQELEMARQVHAEYYLGQVEAYLEGTERGGWLEQLEHEYANLRDALQWALERPASEMALRLGNALLHFWEGHQPLSEGSTFLERTLASSQGVPAQVRASVRFTTEAPALKQSNHEPGAALALEAVVLQRELEEARRLARSLYLLGVIAWIIGDFAMARLYTEEGLVRARDPAEKVTLAYLVDLSGQIALDQGEISSARTLLEEGLMLHREAGDIRGSLNALFFLERTLLALSEVTQARACAEEQFALSKALGFRPGMAGALIFLGRLALEEGNAATASGLFEESLVFLREMNENVPLAVATNLQGIGVTLASQGRLAEAVRLWGAAAALVAFLPEERALVARARTAVYAELSEEAFTVAWAEGQALTLEQALVAIEHIARSSQPLAQATRSARRAYHLLPSSHDLTEREGEVLRLVARGLTDAQVADALVISPRTVNAHLRSIYSKLGIASRHAATLFALEHHLI